MKFYVFFQGIIANFEITSFFPELLSAKLAKNIFGCKGFKFIQMEGHALFQGEINVIVR